MTTRERMVKETFAAAIERLLQTSDLSDVTITDIVKEAGLSKATFYRHFNDKYELAIWRYSFMHSNLPTEWTSRERSKESIFNLIHFIDENKALFKKLMKSGFQTHFDEFYLKSSYDIAKDVRERSGIMLSKKDEYDIYYHANAILAIIHEWLKSGDPISAEDLVNIIDENRSEDIVSIYVNRGDA